MVKQTLLGFSVLLLLILTYGLNQLRMAHADIDSIAPELPALETVRESGLVFDLPVAIAFHNTGSQRAARSSVLNEAHDPASTSGPDPQMIDMSFPAFVLTWQDGRQFVVDVGFSELEAREFSRRSELAGSMPIEFHGLVADKLDVSNVKGVGFTHLHSDHMMGISAFCKPEASFTLVQTMEQYSWHNYLTSSGATLLNELGCGLQLLIDDSLIMKSVRGFPGLYMIHVGGHTLGSQIFVVHVSEGASIATYILAGDMANHFDGIRYNISKPPAYSRWLVPENLDQLYKIRSWLKTMDQESDITVLISHDKKHLAESGLPQL